MRRGVNQWCFPADWTVERMLTEAAKAGFEGVELNVSEAAGDNHSALVKSLGLKDANGLTTTSTTADARAIAARAKELGLTIPSLSTALHWQYPLTDPGEGRKGREIVRRMLELAEAAEAGAILVVPGLVTEAVSYDAAYDRAAEALTELAAEAKAHNVIIGVENVWNKFLLSPLEFRRFLDDVGTDWVKAYFDVGNVLVNGFPDQWIRILGSRLARVHVKDFRQSVGNIHGFAPLLDGDVNWPAVRQALRDVHYSGFVSVEVPPPAHFPEAALRQAAQALDLILA
jgi:L-ribulose-5-phosphate 3-epimerase